MAQQDQGMRMLINDDDDEEDDEDDVDAADDGDEGEDEDEHEDDDPLLYQPESPLGVGPGRIEPGPARQGGSNFESFRVSNGAGACLFLAKVRATSASTG